MSCQGEAETDAFRIPRDILGEVTHPWLITWAGGGVAPVFNPQTGACEQVLVWAYSYNLEEEGSRDSGLWSVDCQDWSVEKVDAALGPQDMPYVGGCVANDDGVLASGIRLGAWGAADAVTSVLLDISKPGVSGSELPFDYLGDRGFVVSANAIEGIGDGRLGELIAGCSHDRRASGVAGPLHSPVIVASESLELVSEVPDGGVHFCRAVSLGSEALYLQSTAGVSVWRGREWSYDFRPDKGGPMRGACMIRFEDGERLAVALEPPGGQGVVALLDEGGAVERQLVPLRRNYTTGMALAPISDRVGGRDQELLVWLADLDDCALGRSCTLHVIPSSDGGSIGCMGDVGGLGSMIKGGVIERQMESLGNLNQKPGDEFVFFALARSSGAGSKTLPLRWFLVVVDSASGEVLQKIGPIAVE